MGDGPGVGMSVTEFLDMGGYAAFVWPAYGIVAVALLLNLILPLKRHQRLRLELGHRTVKTTKPGS
ncbi:MAG: heme exporter protein CcmD [Pseudomonadota bacterium]|nr:heme exporter protein CcmD [Pseudomonadota bacterium]